MDLTTILIDQAHVSLGRLQEAWALLDETLIPGKGSHTARPLTGAARQHLDVQARAERADRLVTAQRGLSALAPARAPLRIGVTVAQARIYRMVIDLCADIARHYHAVYLTYPGGLRPALAAACQWLAGDIPPPGQTSGMLDQIKDGALAEHASRQLDRADHDTRQAAGIGDLHHIQIGVNCPACGQRAIIGDHTSPDWRHWYARCDARHPHSDQPDKWTPCLCSGPGCGCLRPHRRGGDPHVWTGREWATVLTVLDQRAVAAGAA